VRALSAASLGVPGKALRLTRPGGYQARLRRPRNAVPSKITHPLNIIDFTASGEFEACWRRACGGQVGGGCVETQWG